MIGLELEQCLKELATANHYLRLNARDVCGREITPEVGMVLDSLQAQRSASLDWLAARHIVVEVGDSVYRPGGLFGRAKG